MQNENPQEPETAQEVIPATSKPTKKNINSKIAIAIIFILAALSAGFIFLEQAKPYPSISGILTSWPVDATSNTENTKLNDKDAMPEGISSVINANNQFALNLYSKFKGKEQDNIFFSPYSIFSALAMVYEGARGETAQEMESVFYFPIDNSVRKSSFVAINDEINSSKSKYELNVANAIWVQKDYQLLSDYTNTLQKYYDANSNNVDFVGSAEAARQTINGWVENKTNDNIKDLFPVGSFSPLTRLVLTDAIYFKGTWVKQFEKDKTKNEDFQVDNSIKVQVPMMQRNDSNAVFNYAQIDSTQLLEIPYEGDKLSMLVILPEMNNLAPLENSLSLEKIKEWKDKMQEQRVDVYMPKFIMNAKYAMNGILAEMGMHSAFSADADFSGMNGSRDLYINDVIHQAFVEVNEEGTEAAAATGTAMWGTALPGEGGGIPIFRADHPFIFIIQDKTNGNILFLGRVVDPSK